MQPIDRERVQTELERFKHHNIYLHLETTTGAYASHFGEARLNAGAYIRNGQIQFHEGKIAGEGPYRIGLKMADGWVYAEGLTDYEVDAYGRLLLAGHDKGRLAVACELSFEPFGKEHKHD